MFKNTIFMGLTTAAKMLSGIVVFVIMARILGPHDFGLVVYSFTIASLFVLIVDYGFSQQLLRDAGADPNSLNHIVGSVLGAKIVLSILTLLICAFYLRIFPKDSESVKVLLLLLLSSIFFSFSEFLNTAFRCVGMYRKETNVATFGSILHFCILVSTLLIKPDVIFISLSYILSRIIFFVVSWYSYQVTFGHFKINLELNCLFKSLKAGFAYATDSIFTNAFYQLDTIFVNNYLGLAGVGLYQAATKWLQGAMQFAPVLSNVYLPTLSATAADKNINSKHAMQLNLQMIVIGVLGWFFFTFAGKYFTNMVYGNKYLELNAIWPFIGLLMFVRYLAGAQGVILASHGKQKIRVYAQISALILLVITSPFLLTKFGLVGILLALSISIMFLFMVFIIFLKKNNIPNGFNIVTTLMSIIVLTASLLKISY